MLNRKIIYRKPTIPHNFGKKKRRRKKRDYGAILEAAFVLILFIVFLWLVFRTPAHAEAVASDTIPGGRKIHYQSEFNDDSRAARLYFCINAERTARGLPELEFDYALADFAMVRAREIVTNWSHTRPDGSHVSQENLAAYFKMNHEDPEAAIAIAWVNHSGHRETMLNPAYTKVGIASYIDEYGRDYYAAEFR